MINWHIFYNWSRIYNTHRCRLGHLEIGPPILWEGDSQNLFYVFYFQWIRIALKFRKDPFKGVGEIGCKKATFPKQILSPYDGGQSQKFKHNIENKNHKWQLQKM